MSHHQSKKIKLLSDSRCGTHVAILKSNLCNLLEKCQLLIGTALAPIRAEARMPDDQPWARVRGVVHEIWLYMQANPRAKDTVEGIHEWWIQNGKQRFSKEDVQNALEFMIAHRWMQQSTLGARVLYSTTSAAFEEFTRALQELEGKQN